MINTEKFKWNWNKHDADKHIDSFKYSITVQIGWHLERFRWRLKFHNMNYVLCEQSELRKTKQMARNHICLLNIMKTKQNEKKNVCVQNNCYFDWMLNANSERMLSVWYVWRASEQVKTKTNKWERKTNNQLNLCEYDEFRIEITNWRKHKRNQ